MVAASQLCSLWLGLLGEEVGRQSLDRTERVRSFQNTHCEADLSRVYKWAIRLCRRHSAVDGLKFD